MYKLQTIVQSKTNEKVGRSIDFKNTYKKIVVCLKFNDPFYLIKYLLVKNIYSQIIKKMFVIFVSEYLSVAEIGLIVLSGILLFILILLLVYFIIRCQRRKRSRDFLSG